MAAEYEKQTGARVFLRKASKEEAQATFAKVQRVAFSEDSSQVVSLSDSDFRKIWKYTHADVVEWCRKNINGFKQDKKFNSAKESIMNDMNCVYTRRLDNKNSKSASQRFYTELALERIKKYYLL